ncbi:transposase InsO family protein [Burkholderia ambifaria]|nr:transposase InsO family protein [Burkholderia ambifaria]
MIDRTHALPVSHQTRLVGIARSSAYYRPRPISEAVYLKAYESVSHARRSIGEYIEMYNRKRPHSSLADQTPDEAYFATLPAIKSAA